MSKQLRFSWQCAPTIRYATVVLTAKLNAIATLRKPTLTFITDIIIVRNKSVIIESDHCLTLGFNPWICFTLVILLFNI